MELNNNKNKQEVIEFLSEIHNIFYVSLNKKIEIPNYVSKVYNKGKIIAAIIEKEIIGVLLGYCNNIKNEIAYLSTIGVCDKCQGIGVGTKLLRKFTMISRNNNMNQIALHTHKNNISAIEFYNKNGFIQKNDPEKRKNEVYLVKSI